MTRIIFSEDCGNSPKNIFIHELTIAFARGNTKFILENVTDDIRWTLVGDRTIQGKVDFAKSLKGTSNNSVVELTIHHVATHGKAGAVNGTRKLKNGKTFGFCDVYEFGSAKGSLVKEITSYMIEVK